MVPATARLQIAYIPLLRPADSFLVAPDAMKARVTRGRLATACISPAHATAVQPSRQPPTLDGYAVASWRYLATARFQIAYCPLLRRLDTVYAILEAMKACLLRGRLAIHCLCNHLQYPASLIMRNRRRGCIFAPPATEV